VNESEKENIKQGLEQMPQKIFDKEIELLKASNELEELILKKRLIESNTYFDVEMKTDEAGKKIFSNETKRKAETDRLLLTNKDSIELIERIKNRKQEIETEKLLISFLKRKFRSAETIVKLISEVA